MKEQIAEYLISLYKDIPMAVYEGLLSVLCLGTVAIIVCYGLKRRRRKVAGLLLSEYILLIYCSTVICRITMAERRYDFHPFWSYKAIEAGRVELLTENMMNVLVFVPVGLLLGIAFKNIRWWQVLLISLSISIVIELLQFILMKGFSELDDVMHNTLGCMIGMTLAGISMIMIRKLIKQ